MSQTLLYAPFVPMKEFTNLFIEMTSKNCNLKCKHCYLDFEPFKKIDDYINIEKIKEALWDLQKENLQMIHLTGGEPFLHPNFNTILRLCLKSFPVTVHTNGQILNEKKARFLRKVEDEGENEIFFKISLVSYEERKNDDIRGRGSFRKAIYAYNNLLKYDFYPQIMLVNYYNENSNDILENFRKVFESYNIDAGSINIKIIPYIDKNKTVVEENKPISLKNEYDCSCGRLLNSKGVYNCPLMSKDDRGRSGGNFKDYSQKSHIESSVCIQCAQNKQKLFSYI